jgi:AcrR family transcriptional regulator
MGDTIPTGTTAGPKQARSKQTREKIIQAAIQLFEELGYEKTTSNEIASAAGVSVGSFYVYFSDKRQVLLTIFDQLADDLFKNVFVNLKPEDLFDSELRPRIRQAIANAIIDKQKHSGLHRVIWELVLKDAEFAARSKALTERSIAKLHEIVSLANKAGLAWELDIDAAVFIVHRVVFDISQDYVTGVIDFDSERAVNAISDMIYRYLFKPRD